MFIPTVETDILIVGAGPVGMLLAILLGKSNVNTIIIDKRTEITNIPRAIAINQSSLELFESLGIMEDMQKHAMLINKTEVFWNKKYIGDINFKNIQTKFPYFFHLSQNYVEKCLGNCLEKQNINILREHCIYNIENNATDNIQISFINTKDGKYKIKSHYIIGADGGQSTVRGLMNFNLDIDFYGSYFILFDIITTKPICKTNQYFFNNNGYCMLVPKAENRYRIIMSFIVIPDDILDEKNLIQFVRNHVQERAGIEIEGITIEWHTYSKFGHRIATRAVKNKIILAGDALHQFSPIGGTNMNFGLQDANYLAAIIPQLLAASGNDDTLLNKYNEDRLANMQKQLIITKKFTQLFTHTNSRSIAEYKDCHKMLKSGNISNFLTGNSLWTI